MLSFTHFIPPIKKFGLKPFFLDLDFDRSGPGPASSEKKELSLVLDPGAKFSLIFL